MNIEQSRLLLQKYRMGLCTAEEKKAIETWYNSLANTEEWNWDKTEKEMFKKELTDRISSAIKEDGVSPLFRKRVLSWKLAAAAALFTIVLGTAFYHAVKIRQGVTSSTIASRQEQHKKDVNPGTDGAILILSGGKEIVLDSISNTLVASDGHVSIIRKNGGLVYEINGDGTGQTSYNTIITPKARQFHFQLSDGTRVWLNAASSIRYPVAFNGNHRSVEVTGEVYFEVRSLRDVSGDKIPFVVKINTASAGGGEIEVLGTHFNVNAYDNEEAVKTTLIEGKVKVSYNASSVLLSPGNQSQLNKAGKFSIVPHADTEQIMAWKNGYFSFDRTSLRSAMQQLERWYDIKVVYMNGKVPDEYFSGELPRAASLSAVLNAFKLSGVSYDINGNTLTVLQKNKLPKL